MMKGWGAQDDFQEQIEATVSDRLAFARHHLNQKGKRDCEDCCREIPQARREAYPAAIRCVPCQSMYE